MKLRYKGKIRELNHIIISDPSYDESVTCRYENNNLKEKDWYVDIDIKPTVDEIEDLTIKGTEFFLFLSKDRRLSELRENGAIRYLSGIELKETEIGMDTACVAIGINEKADEIIDYLQYQLNITELEKDITKSMIIRQQDILDKMKEFQLRFKEITKEDPKLLQFFDKDNRFSNITFAGTYLAGIAVRNEQRKAGNLDGKIEHSPYSKEQEKLIEEYTNLRVEFEKTEQEIENDIDI